MPSPFHLMLSAIAVTLLLAGCAHDKATRSVPAATTSVPAATKPAATTRSPPHTRKHKAANADNVTPTVTATLPDRTGIAACDDYLASYLACHRAAQIYVPGQLQARYQAMRTSLLRDSMDEDIRPQLAARCNSLATQLRTALHGKACAPEPAAASSSP